MSILSQNILLHANLKEYFDNNPKQFKIILPIIQGKSDISIRIIDWFVTNYCKKNNISYDLSSKTEPFMVWQEYKSQLKGYSKKLFDPFCRKERINYVYDNTKEVITTLGQLNFFRWALENKVIDYVKKNMENIESDMLNSCKYDSKKDSGERRKRRELSLCATRSVNKRDVKITLKFD